MSIMAGLARRLVRLLAIASSVASVTTSGSFRHDAGRRRGMPGFTPSASPIQNLETTVTVDWHVEPAALKLSQTTPVGPMPTSSSAVDIAMQAGECESRQLRLRLPAKNPPIRSVRVTWSQPRPTAQLAGLLEDQWHWSARQVGFVHCETPTMYNCSGDSTRS